MPFLDHDWHDPGQQGGGSGPGGGGGGGSFTAGLGGRGGAPLPSYLGSSPIGLFANRRRMMGGPQMYPQMSAQPGSMDFGSLGSQMPGRSAMPGGFGAGGYGVAPGFGGSGFAGMPPQGGAPRQGGLGGLFGGQGQQGPNDGLYRAPFDVPANSWDPLNIVGHHVGPLLDQAQDAGAFSPYGSKGMLDALTMRYLQQFAPVAGRQRMAAQLALPDDPTAAAWAGLQSGLQSQSDLSNGLLGAWGNSMQGQQDWLRNLFGQQFGAAVGASGRNQQGLQDANMAERQRNAQGGGFWGDLAGGLGGAIGMGLGGPLGGALGSTAGGWLGGKKK